MRSIDHPIFIESIRFIRKKLDSTGLEPLEQQVLERLIHSSGDFTLANLLRFSPSACDIGRNALLAGASILTDTSMAYAAISPMAKRTLQTSVYCALDWVSEEETNGLTRTELGMNSAWKELSLQNSLKPAPIVIIGSAPTALNSLLALVENGAKVPSLIIGMPVGFIGVINSKERLASSGIPNIRLIENRGGAGLAAAAINSLMRSCIDA